MATLTDITDRLARVRSKERGYIAIQGFCRVLVALALVVIAYFLIDWFADLPFGVRLTTAGIGLAIIAYVAYRYLYVELRKIQDDDEIALRVESRNPDLRGRLISTLQLVRSEHAGAYAGSHDLIAALEEETVRMSDPLDFAQIISTTMLKRLLIAALIVVVVKAALIFEFPEHFKALAERLVNPNKQFPTKTRIKKDASGKEMVAVPAFVARGEEILVEVALEPAPYVVPNAGVLHFMNPKSGMNIPVELLPAGGEVFKGRLAKALEDVDMVVEIGDVRTKPVRVDVLARPEVDTSRSVESLRYELPAYTEEPPQPWQKFGTLSSLQGSLAEIRFTATKALKSAEIRRSDGRSYPMTKLPVPNEPAGMSWTVNKFPIDKSGTFHVVLVDEFGLKNGEPALEYPIDARADLAPTIKLLKPSHDATVTPTARPILKYNARDDYGLRVVWLVYKLKHDTGEAPAKSEDDYNDDSKIPAKRIEYKIDRDETKRIRKELSGATITWDLADLKVKVGDQIIFWLECDDYCETNDEVPARKTPDGAVIEAPAGTKVYPRTQDVKFTVISRQDKEAELRAELARLFQQLERHEKTQEEVKRSSVEILEALQKLQ
jgi:hypothetical protein